MSRQDYNREIVHILQDYINDNPDLRFIQALWNLGLINYQEKSTVPFFIEDRHYEEPKITLDKIKQHLQKGHNDGEIKEHD